MKTSMFAKSLAIAGIGALVLGIAPKARAEGGCSEATLKGSFAYTSTGALVASPVPASMWGPYAEVGKQYFNGSGGKDSVSFGFNASQNGNIGPGTATGTYTVNEDCTGTFTETSGGFTSHFNLVIDADGQEFQAICQDAGVVVTRIGRRQVIRVDE